MLPASYDKNSKLDAVKAYRNRIIEALEDLPPEIFPIFYCEHVRSTIK